MIKSTLQAFTKRLKYQTRESYTLHALFFKRKSEGYKPKKAAVILGIMSACGRQMLQVLLYENVKDLGDTLLIQIINTKTKLDRTFTVTGRYYDVVKKYMDVRPGQHGKNSSYSDEIAEPRTVHGSLF